MKINCLNNEGTQDSVTIDRHADECPFCHKALTPIFIYAYRDKRKWNSSNVLEIVYRCPAIDCQNLFISNFKSHDSSCISFFFNNSIPLAKKDRKFSEIIYLISKNFCDIYNQAFLAEQDDLLEVCGVGYRKALEFLIKDYAIIKNPNKEGDIKKEFLSSCISNYIKNENIKKVAERAIWLGNDETHYLRKWESKELKDLKDLIALTIHWFEMEELTEKIIKDMPS